MPYNQEALDVQCKGQLLSSSRVQGTELGGVGDLKMSQTVSCFGKPNSCGSGRSGWVVYSRIQNGNGTVRVCVECMPQEEERSSSSA